MIKHNLEVYHTSFIINITGLVLFLLLKYDSIVRNKYNTFTYFYAV